MTVETGVQVTRYLVVLAALLVLTLVTVAVARLSLPPVPTIVIGLAIAALKASLVALVFMHLIHERAAVVATLVLTAVVCAALFGLTLWTGADPVPGTEYSSSFGSQEASR